MSDQTAYASAVTEAATNWQAAAGQDLNTSTVARERSAQFKYWRRPNGYIIVGPSPTGDIFRYQKWFRKGYRDLPDMYGVEYMNKGRMTLAKTAGQSHRWLEPFFEKGGHVARITSATAMLGPVGDFIMSVDQIRELGLHRQEWMQKDRPDCIVVDLTCPYNCYTENGKPRLFSTEQALNQHIAAAHRDATASIATGEAMAKALKEAKVDAPGIDVNLIATIVATTIKSLGIMDKDNPMNRYAVKPEIELPEGTPTVDWQRRDINAWVKRQRVPVDWARAFRMKTPEYIEYIYSLLGVDVPQAPSEYAEASLEELQNSLNSVDLNEMVAEAAEE